MRRAPRVVGERMHADAGRIGPGRPQTGGGAGMTVRDGGCACGAVRFRAEGDPRFAFVCHCGACRRKTGTGHAASAAYPRDAVAITGAARVYPRPAPAGHAVDQAFCGTCGSPLWNTTPRAETLIMLDLGAFDDPSGLTPGRVFHAEDALPWDIQPWHDHPQGDAT